MKLTKNKITARKEFEWKSLKSGTLAAGEMVIRVTKFSDFVWTASTGLSRHFLGYYVLGRELSQSDSSS